MSTIKEQLQELMDLRDKMEKALQYDPNAEEAQQAQEEFNEAITREFLELHQSTEGLECECTCGEEETGGLEEEKGYSLEDFLIDLDFTPPLLKTEGLVEGDQVTKNQLEVERQEELLRKYTEALSIVE